MSQYIAKKASLDVKRECSDRSCGCYTDRGYYIQYENSSVHSVLFVCEECYIKKYKSRCVLGDFTMEKRRRRGRLYSPPDHPILSGTVRIFNRTIRGVRLACVWVLILLGFFVFFSGGEYSLREEPVRTDTQTAEVFQRMNERFERLTQRVNYAFSDRWR